MADNTEPDETELELDRANSYKTEPEETSNAELLEEKEDSTEDFREEEDTSTLVVKEEADESEYKPVSEPKFRLYRWRWFMLATLLLLNISNGTVC